MWSGTSPVSGADLEIDLVANGTVGQDVWVYCNNSSIGSESLSKIMGGYSSIEADLGIEYVAQLDGLTKSWQLSGPVIAPAGEDFKASFYMKGFNNNLEGLFSSSDPQSWLRILSSDNSINLQGQLGAGYYQGIPFTEVNLRDGIVRKISVERVAGSMRIVLDDTLIYNLSSLSSEFSIETLGKLGSDYFGGILYGFEFELNGSLMSNHPL